MNVLIPTGKNDLWNWIRTTNYVEVVIKSDRSIRNVKHWSNFKSVIHTDIKNYYQVLGKFYNFHG